MLEISIIANNIQTINERVISLTNHINLKNAFALIIQDKN